MHTAETSSPEEEVPEVVSELKPHRWKVRPVRLAHFTVQRWTPYGKPPSVAAALTNGKAGKKKNNEFIRTLRPRISEEPEAAIKDQAFKVRDPKSDPVYSLILKTIK